MPATNPEHKQNDPPSPAPAHQLPRDARQSRTASERHCLNARARSHCTSTLPRKQEQAQIPRLPLLLLCRLVSPFCHFHAPSLPSLSTHTLPALQPATSSFHRVLGTPSWASSSLQSTSCKPKSDACQVQPRLTYKAWVT